MNAKAYGLIDGHLVAWEVRNVTWCSVCAVREASRTGDLCVRCDADARLLVASVFPTQEWPAL